MKPKLLIVDDEVPILNLLRGLLESLGAEVLATADSQEALKCLDEKSFDAILLDIHMPVLGGIELTKRIRASALNKKAPIVILTGWDDADTMREAFRAGATYFLGKPITRDRIQGLYTAICGPVFLEHRRQTRLPFRTKVKCTWGSHGERSLLANSLDIGEGGMLLQPSGGLEIGQELNVELVLPSAKRPVQMRAKITCKEPPGCMGVEFIDTTVTAREAIQDYIVGAIQE